MAKVELMFPFGFMDQLNSLDYKLPDIMGRTLEEGAAIVFAAIKSKLGAVIGSNSADSHPHPSTGELEGALGISPIKPRIGGGYDVKVGFNEPRSDGGVNAKIANILEYGNSRQRPRPFLKPARASSYTPAQAAMMARLEREMQIL